MFKFGFSSDDCENDTDGKTSDINEKQWDECKELVPKQNELIENIITSSQYNILQLNEVQIKYVCSKNVLEVLRKLEHSEEVAVLKAEENHSDLLPAVYEGGFKIWECTYDILNYLDENKINFENKKVLDLGCGAGIIGIYALLNGSTCFFQDYNSDVIEYVTIPNVLLNSKDSINVHKFFSGDWNSFSNVLEGDANEINKFDFIFTSETIYNTENYYKLHKVFEKLLKRNGAIYLAAKSFYFGVGGGISLFQDFLARHNTFNYSCCWKCKEGINREILKITFNHNKPCDP